MVLKQLLLEFLMFITPKRVADLICKLLTFVMMLAFMGYSLYNVVINSNGLKNSDEVEASVLDSYYDYKDYGKNNSVIVYHMILEYEANGKSIINNYDTTVKDRAGEAGETIKIHISKDDPIIIRELIGKDEILVCKMMFVASLIITYLAFFFKPKQKRR